MAFGATPPGIPHAEEALSKFPFRFLIALALSSLVAAPVSGEETAEKIEEMVDEAVILDKPPFFRAVAQVYMNWYDVPDSEVIAIMEKWSTRQNI